MTLDDLGPDQDSDVDVVSTFMSKDLIGFVTELDELLDDKGWTTLLEEQGIVAMSTFIKGLAEAATADPRFEESRERDFEEDGSRTFFTLVSNSLDQIGSGVAYIGDEGLRPDLKQACDQVFEMIKRIKKENHC